MMLAGEDCPDFFVFGEPVRFELRENFILVQEHLEAAIPERLQLQERNALLEFFQNFPRQTDGVRFVLSARTVFDFDLHCSALRKEDYRGGASGGVWACPLTPPVYS